MGILLSLFIGFNTPIMPIPIIFTSESSDLTTVYKKDTINLNELKANDSNINLNYLYNKNPIATEEEIKQAILIDITSNNTDSIINEIMLSVLTEKEKWIISGINFEIPKLQESVDYEAKFLSLDSSKYTGVLSVKVKLSNFNTIIQDLNEVILNKNLSTIVFKDNPNIDQVLEILQEKNPVIDINEIIVKILSYKNAEITAKKDSSKYSGSSVVNFTSNIILKKDGEWTSDYISLSSYSGPETKTSNHEFKYDSLDKNDFLINFTKIKITFSGTAITSRPQWVNNYFNSEIKDIKINSSDNTKNDFWYYEQQWYGNFDASSAWLETSWENNTFALNSVAWAKVDSSAISTDYSKAKTQLIIEGISFE